MKKNSFFTFCFSLIPGAGQMYQSYMKRGLSILILFSIFICLAILIETPIFLIFGLIVLIYSFFDTFHIRNFIDTENQIEDSYIWGSNALGTSIDNLFSQRSSLLGFAFLFIGIYLLLNNVLAGFAYRLDIEWLYEVTDVLVHYLPSLIIAMLSVGIGIKLMFNKKG